jgi:hypothetical protein
MRTNTERREEQAVELIEIGSASELTQGSFMPQVDESVTLKDRFEE